VRVLAGLASEEATVIGSSEMVQDSGNASEKVSISTNSFSNPGVQTE
jgi:hypothetical protein